MSKTNLIRCWSPMWEIAQENINMRDRLDLILDLIEFQNWRRNPFPWKWLTIIIARDRDSKSVVGILRKYIEVADGRGHWDLNSVRMLLKEITRIFSITGGRDVRGDLSKRKVHPKKRLTWPDLLPRSHRSDLRDCWKTIWSRSSSSNHLFSKLCTCHKNAYVHHDKRSLVNNIYFSKARAETLDYIKPLRHEL